MSRSNQLAGLITATPTATLDTINEINTSLNNDANLSTTLTNSIATKAPLASPTFTGDAVFDTSTLKVDATNNRVGIGRTDPQTTLDIAHSGSSNSGAVRIGDPSTIGNNTSIYMRTTGDATIGTGGGDIVFDTNIGSAPRMRIQHSTGNVGIGTGTNIDQLLHVESNANTYIQTETTSGTGASGIIAKGTGSTFYVYNQGSSDNLRIFEDSGCDVNITPAGNVGIGVSDPDVEVEIKKSSANATLAINAGSANDAQLQFRTGDANDYTIYVDGSETNDPLHFWDHASGTAPMTLVNGNVGIGTSSPSQKLTVNGNIDMTNIMRFGGNNGSLYLQALGSGNGRVGIGTTAPSTELHVEGTTTCPVVVVSAHQGGNLSTNNANPKHAPPVGFFSIAFSLTADNNWVKLMDTLNNTRGVFWATVSDQPSGDNAHYSWRASSPAYGVSTFDNVWYKNGGWNTGSFNFRMVQNGSVLELQVQYSSYYGANQTGSGQVTFLRLS